MLGPNANPARGEAKTNPPTQPTRGGTPADPIEVKVGPSRRRFRGVVLTVFPGLACLVVFLFTTRGSLAVVSSFGFRPARFGVGVKIAPRPKLAKKKKKNGARGPGVPIYFLSTLALGRL